MFDVIWTDPDRELLGEHRAKKERRRDQKDKNGTKSSNNRSSLSTKRSSLSSGGDSSPFSFLRSHGLRRINTSDANSKTRSSASSRLASPSVSSARSPNSSSFDTKSRPSSGLAATCSSEEPPTSGNSFTKGRGAGENQSPGISLHDSVIPRNSESDVAPSCSCGAASTNASEDIDQRHKSHPSKPSGFTTVFQNIASTATGSLSRTAYENATWPRSSKRLPPPIARMDSDNSCPTEVFVPGPLPPIYPLRLPNVHDSQLWTDTDHLSTEASNHSRTIDVLADMLAKCDVRSLGVNSALDIDGWRNEIKQMSSTNITDMVLKLKNILELDTDSSSRTEREAEGVRWMLWALDHLDSVPVVDHSATFNSSGPREVSERVLLLHESQDTTAYQLAIHSTKELHHLSPHPIEQNFATNLRNVLVSSTSPSDFSTSATNYDAVISLSLPCVLPADDIPSTLSHVHSCLRSQGTLRLLIIDPTPVVGTSGPRLRAWLRNHLLTNLESATRCSYPSKFFPKWLADASLRGQGSTLTTTKFYALPSSVHSHLSTTMEEQSSTEDTPSQEIQDERVTKAEARCLIGRLLWKHIWGSFVTGEKWWWNDPDCVRECLEMGTVWEYHMIEAVKDDAPSAEIISLDNAVEGQ